MENEFVTISGEAAWTAAPACRAGGRCCDFLSPGAGQQAARSKAAAGCRSPGRFRLAGARLCGLLVALMLLPAFFADAVPGAGKAVREGAEGLSKKIARETAESASASMSRQIERLALRHGDEVRPLLRRIGPDAVEVAARYGDDGIRLMGRYGNDGAAALARSGDEILPLVHRHGDEVLGAAIRHPGVGERLVAEFGADGIRLSRRLSTDEAVTLLRRSGPAATAAPARSGRVVEFAKRHPEWIAGGAAAGVLVVHPEWFRSILGNLGHGLGSGIHSFAEGLFGERAAGWVIAGLVFLLFALAVIVLAGPRFLKVWLRSRRVPSF